MAKKHFSQKPTEVTRRWILIDAKDAPLGRLSTEIAKYPYR
jgi:ribosomal protein L13